MSTGAALAAINLTISARTERQWQGIRRPKGRNPRADAQRSQWDDADWDQDHEEAARSSRAPAVVAVGFRLSPTRRLGSGAAPMGCRRTLGKTPCRRDRGSGGDLCRAASAGCGGGSAPGRSISRWRRRGWRRRSRKISATATPSRSAAPRSSAPGEIRIAVRIRDIIVRDRDHAIVASAPKAEVKLSGTALLMGRLRAESLNLVDAELAVRITPDGYVTVSAGDTAKPLATGVASKKEAGLPPTFPRQTPGSVARPLSSPALRPVPPPSARREYAKRIARRPRLARQPEPDRT